MVDYSKFMKMGLMSPSSKSDAAWAGLLQLAGQFGARGAPRTTPTPPPIDLGSVMSTYQTSLNNDLSRGLAFRKLERDDEKYNLEKSRRTAMLDLLKPRTSTIPYTQTTDVDNDGAETSVTRMLNVSQPSALMQSLPLNLRPTVEAAIKGGLGAQVLPALIAAQAKPAKMSSIQREAAALYPNDMAARHRFIKNYREKTGGTTVEINQKPNNVMGTIIANEAKNAFENAGLAGTKLTRLNEMKTLLASGVPQGKVADLTLSIRNILADFGIGGDNVAVQTAINSLGKELALDKHGPGMGPMTDADFLIYQAIVPQLGNTVAANNLIMRRMEREYLGQQKYANKIKMQLQSEEGQAAFDPAKAWREVAAELNEEFGQLIPTFASQEEFAKTGDKYVGQIVSIKGKAFEVTPDG